MIAVAVAAVSASAASCGSPDEGANAVSSASVATVRPTQTPSPTPSAVQETQTEPVPFAQVTVEDPTRPQGESVVTTAGVVGTRTLVCDVTRLRGAELSRTLISDTITTPPVDEVTSLGTYVAPAPEPVPFAGTGGNCDPNYEGACVRIDSDVDCAGGSGNGPSYVSGPVYVVGSDIYQLDRDGDGVGCE